MKKLALKNLTIKKLSNQEKSTIKGGTEVPKDTTTSGCCNDHSVWPVACSSAAWMCSL